MASDTAASSGYGWNLRVPYLFDLPVIYLWLILISAFSLALFIPEVIFCIYLLFNTLMVPA